MPICAKCQNQVAGGHKFCASCGAPVSVLVSDNGNFLKKLWNGEYPLWKTYWGFLVLGNLFFLTVQVPLIKVSERLNMTWEFIYALNNVWKFIFGVYTLIVSVGVFNAARKYSGEESNKGWAYSALIINTAFFVKCIIQG